MASEVFTQGGSQWVNKVTDLCTIALGDQSAAVQQQQNAFYPDRLDEMEATVETEGQVEFRLRESEAKHELQNFWLSACEDSLNVNHDSHALSTVAEAELHRLGTKSPSRTSWHSIDIKKQANYAPQRPSYNGAPSYYDQNTNK